MLLLRIRREQTIRPLFFKMAVLQMHTSVTQNPAKVKKRPEFSAFNN